MAEKSSNELIPMLKNAYSALKDKEKDLMLAAEIGKSLLENNIRLKTSYEDLLQQTQRSCTAPLPTPSSSLATQQYPDNDDDHQLQQEDTEEYDDEDDDDDMRFVPSHRTREAMIEVLERKNVELAKRLETVMAEKETTDKNNQKHTRKLESEIDALKSNLEIASTKIQELEEMNERQRRMDRLKEQRRLPEEDQEQQQMMDDLLTKIDELQVENNTVLSSKAQLESKLAETLRDLSQLKHQFEQFQFTQKDYETLQEAYERQFRHIAELNASVEEHRTVLQKLKDRGVSVHSTPAPSVCGGASVSPGNQGIRHTLLGELESEWLKRHVEYLPSALSAAASVTSFGTSIKTSPLKEYDVNDDEAISSTMSTERNALESVLAKVSGIDSHVLDEALSFISKLEDENDKCLDLIEYDVEGEDMDFDIFPARDLYPDPNTSFAVVERVTHAPKTFVGRVRRAVFIFFRAVWRWCRFAMILTTAVIISVWNGPEGMLLEY
ncbi:hypothetical protein K492DRAFT_216725 [Lichtheimia hyalospora FSU 10163]|nr:hypothetical protein K492DRAFT_216725 [Lichtheimia hyalospora FSU 10163]